MKHNAFPDSAFIVLKDFLKGSGIQMVSFLRGSEAEKGKNQIRSEQKRLEMRFLFKKLANYNKKMNKSSKMTKKSSKKYKYEGKIEQKIPKIA